MSGCSLRITSVTNMVMSWLVLLRGTPLIKTRYIVYLLLIKIAHLNIQARVASEGLEIMPNITVFNPDSHHIRLVGAMKTPKGVEYEFRAILDTGAPTTEFSDQFLYVTGLIEGNKSEILVKSGWQSQKYDKLIVPQVKICGHLLREKQVYVSHYEKHWGVDALIGLDFFRQFRVTIDYKAGQIITEPFANPSR